MREKIAIVNENDKEIAVKFRDEQQIGDIQRIVGIWITNDVGDILLAQRALHKELHPGLWGTAAAGAVSYGETYEQAAYKELAEEIGVFDIKLELVKKGFYHGSDHKRWIGWYKGVCTKPAQAFVLEKDVAQVMWISPNELKLQLTSTPEKFVPSCVLWENLFLS